MAETQKKTRDEKHAQQAGSAFTAKLARLTTCKNRAEIARAAGLSETMVSNYINRGSVPRADIALALSRALDVSLDWLADPAASWPPPAAAITSSNDLRTVSDSELMAEVCRRFCALTMTNHRVEPVGLQAGRCPGRPGMQHSSTVPA